MTDDEFGVSEFSADSHDSGDGIYANAEKGQELDRALRAQRGDSSDEVDPRKLVRDPTLSEIRWYYRRTFAKVLVDKPIDDAFKNGFEFVGENADDAQKLIDKPRFDGEGEGFIGAYKLAEKKARRDGFSLVFLGTRERGSAGLHESPIDDDVDVDRVSHCKVLTVDDLTEAAPQEQIEDATGLDHTQYEVRNTGIVINTDITDPDYRTPVGYVLDGPEPQFIHEDRTIHLTWNPEVDGDYDSGGVRRYRHDDSYLGQYEGDSVLIPTYDLIKGITKGNWAVMQAVFRSAAHMYTVTLPEDGDDEDMQNALSATRNINAKSSLVFPHGYEVEQHESGNEMEPEQHFQVLFDQICAGHEMTKSVLFGTQAGTVSGSEVDIKNYFNKVERYRTNRAESKIGEFLTKSRAMTDSRTSEDYTFDMDMEWEPLFEVDADTRIQMLQNETQALTTLIGNFALTPDEAREILSEEFTDIDLDDLTETQLDELDRINLTRSGQGPSAERAETEYTEGPGDPEAEGQSSPSSNASQGGTEGGREQGQQQASQNPASDSAVDQLERLAELHEGGLLTDDEFAAAKSEVFE